MLFAEYRYMLNVVLFGSCSQAVKSHYYHCKRHFRLRQISAAEMATVMVLEIYRKNLILENETTFWKRPVRFIPC